MLIGLGSEAHQCPLGLTRPLVEDGGDGSRYAGQVFPLGEEGIGWWLKYLSFKNKHFTAYQKLSRILMNYLPRLKQRKRDIGIEVLIKNMVIK
jgi:hypothetical protein